MWRRLLFLFPLSLLPLSLLPLSLGGCFDLLGGCENEIIRRTLDPSGTRQAVLFERGCGATTGFNAEISVMARGEDPKEAGNAFVADYASSGSAGSVGRPWTEAVWVSPHRLLIRYDRNARVFISAPAVGDVAIQYESVGHSKG
jgi:hypothetical protein